MTLKSALAADLSALFKADIPSICRIGARDYTVLVDDLISDEIEGFGGPEAIEIQRVHFLTADKQAIENGSKLALKVGNLWKSKIVVSNITSSDGAELIATVRGD